MPTSSPGRWNASRRAAPDRQPPHQPARWSRRSTPAMSSEPARRGPSLYELVLREAIAVQHGLSHAERMELHACDGCGKPYLLAGYWQPISEEGSIACPRCGTEAATWEGARGYVAYWQREPDGLARFRAPRCVAS
ncbi:MAG: hypothetical protein IT306_12355 [Chloroflexi bacterium]|nr:hypothetical protein [Chloroflexota bacterium]